MPSRSNLLARAALLLVVLASLGATAAWSCQVFPQLPVICPGTTAQLKVGFTPSRGPCASGVVTATVTVCSVTGGTYDWTVGPPLLAEGGGFAGCPLSAASCTTTTPPTAYTGTLAIAPGSCDSATVTYELTGCPVPRLLRLLGSVTDVDLPACTRTLFDCETVLEYCPELAPTTRLDVGTTLLSAHAGETVGWDACIAFDGDSAHPTTRNVCLDVRQLNLFAAEHVDFKVVDGHGNVLADEPMIDIPRGTPRDVSLGSFAIPPGGSESLRIECPFHGACFPGLSNTFDLTLTEADASGACTGPILGRRRTTVLIDGYPRLALEHLTDLGGGRARIDYLVRGPITDVEFATSVRGQLQVVEARAFFEDNPHLPPTTEVLVPIQPAVVGNEVTLDLPAVDARNFLDPSKFDDLVVVRVEVENPSGKRPKGDLDFGAVLRWNDAAGEPQTLTLPPARLPDLRKPLPPASASSSSSRVPACDSIGVGGGGF